MAKIHKDDSFLDKRNVLARYFANSGSMAAYFGSEKYIKYLEELKKSGSNSLVKAFEDKDGKTVARQAYEELADIIGADENMTIEQFIDVMMSDKVNKRMKDPQEIPLGDPVVTLYNHIVIILKDTISDRTKKQIKAITHVDPQLTTEQLVKPVTPDFL